MSANSSAMVLIERRYSWTLDVPFLTVESLSLSDMILARDRLEKAFWSLVHASVDDVAETTMTWASGLHDASNAREMW